MTTITVGLCYQERNGTTEGPTGQAMLTKIKTKMGDALDADETLAREDHKSSRDHRMGWGSASWDLWSLRSRASPHGLDLDPG